MRPPRPNRPDRPTRGKTDASVSPTTTANKPAGPGAPAEEASDSPRPPKRVGLGARAGAGAGAGAGAERWAGVARKRVDNRLDGEDAWSCCGRTVAASGRGCGPREPPATPEDLLLDAIDPRSRLGQPLDFREFLPRIAWFGSSLDPMIPFAGSPSEGTLRPHTAPERLCQGQGGDYHRSAARSRSGGRTTSDGKFSRNFRGNTTSPSQEEETFDAWRNTGPKTAHKKGGGGGRSTRHNVFRHPSPVARLPSTMNTAWGQGSEKRTLLGPGWGGGDIDATNDRGTVFAGDDGVDSIFGGGGDEGGDCLSRTHIMGMNGGRLPREVRQVPIDRPLTAPCGKVGRQRVRARSVGGPVNP